MAVWKTVPLNQIPNTNNRQPTTNNQQPTTNNQQPTTYHYTFIDILLLIGSILATDETLTFVGDYRNCSKCKMLKSVIWLQ